MLAVLKAVFDVSLPYGMCFHSRYSAMTSLLCVGPQGLKAYEKLDDDRVRQIHEKGRNQRQYDKG